MAFDETGQADTTERKVEICQRAYSLLTEKAGFDPTTSSSTPTSSPSRPGSRSTPSTRSTSSRRRGLIKEKLPGSEGQRRREQPLVLLPRQRPRCARRSTRRSSTTRSAAGMDMGIVNAGQLGVYEDIPRSCSSTWRTSSSIVARRHRAHGRARRDSVGKGERQEAGGRPLLAGGARRRAPPTRWSTAWSISSRRTRRGARSTRAPAPVIEGPLMDGMKDRGRPLRRGEDVPARRS